MDKKKMQVLLMFLLGILLGGSGIYFVLSNVSNVEQMSEVLEQDLEEEVINRNGINEVLPDPEARDAYYNDTDVRIHPWEGPMFPKDFGTYLTGQNPEVTGCEMLDWQYRLPPGLGVDFPEAEFPKNQTGPLQTPKLKAVAAEYFEDGDLAEQMLVAAHQQFVYRDLTPAAFCNLDQRVFIIGLGSQYAFPFEMTNAAGLISYQPIPYAGVGGGLSLLEFEGKTMLMKAYGDGPNFGWNTYELDFDRLSTIPIERCSYSGWVSETEGTLDCQFEYQP